MWITTVDKQGAVNKDLEAQAINSPRGKLPLCPAQGRKAPKDASQHKKGEVFDTS
ncbi:hypothetical protein GCM10007338_20540 [Corynebacterium pelargi]|nr:hypothetical protein GCM10007338_20540 [Corynebacterium pelargi]